MTNSSNKDGNEINFEWYKLYKIGGIAAILAGVLFRRNIAAELALFTNHKSLETAKDWFELLQSNRLLGLAYLNLFDLVNYSLIVMMFIALYILLRKVNQSVMLVATSLGLIGVSTYLASNKAFSMLYLSSKYSIATTDAQRDAALSAGQVMLSMNHFSNTGSGGFVSLLFVALAGMLISIVMLRCSTFYKATAIVGMLASGLDIAYCIIFTFAPIENSDLIAICFIPVAGLLLMIWHILVGWSLFKYGRIRKNQLGGV